MLEHVGGRGTPFIPPSVHPLCSMERVSATEETIEDFIARCQQIDEVKDAPQSEEGAGEWEQLAPGLVAEDYRPKQTDAISIPPPLPPINDTGRTPNAVTRKDIEDPSAELGVCGLLNMGNTCYMNAGLQCVRSVPQLTQFYLSDSVPFPTAPGLGEKGEKKVDEEGGVASEGGGGGEVDTEEVEDKEAKISKELPHVVARGHISARFATLVRKLWSGRFSALLPKSFKTTVSLLYPQFDGFRQQDSQEFLAVLLDRLHEDVIQSNSKGGGEGGGGGGGGGGGKERGCVGSCSSNEDTHSIITETFQGQLRNEVTCCVCGHTSIKTDPFIYLSLPLPHSHEMQLEVLWVPVCRSPDRRQIIKMLVTVSKLATVADVKLAVCEMVGGVVTPDHVVVVYVKDSAVECTLVDTLAVKRLKSPDECSLYVFETEVTVGGGVAEVTVGGGVAEVTVGGGVAEVTVGGANELGTVSTSPIDAGGGGSGSQSSQGVDSDLRPSHPDSQQLLTEKVKDGGEEEEERQPAKLLCRDTSTQESTPAAPELEQEEGGGGGGERTVVVMEWHTCAICLEEMEDEDLLTHTSCGAILCSSCLQAAQQHSSSGGSTGGADSLPCPVCQVTVQLANFIPLATKEKSRSVVRLLQVTVLFRYKEEEEDNMWKLCGHPAVLNLPCSATGECYHNLLSPLLPPTFTSVTLSLTDWKGRYCSRCEFTAGCRGCAIQSSPVEVSLKPGDHIAVSLSGVSLEETTPVSAHPSLESRWLTAASLQDCIELFSQRELLSKDNPWYCPVCKQDQPAHRQLMVSSLPPALIVHLKRFLFHGSTASKVNMSVDFPLSLPISTFPNLTSSAADLVLTACVCHFGTADSGHYTAYSRHPLTGKWYYYNDETVTEAEPSEKDRENVYILFYQQQQNALSSSSSSMLSCSVGEAVVFPTEQEELQQMDQLLRVFKPKPAACPPPLHPPQSGFPLRRSTSLGSVMDTSADSDRQLQLALAASLGLELPPPSPDHPPRLWSSSSSSNLQQASEANLINQFSRQAPTPDTSPGITLVSVSVKPFDA